MVSREEEEMDLLVLDGGSYFSQRKKFVFRGTLNKHLLLDSLVADVICHVFSSLSSVLALSFYG